MILIQKADPIGLGDQVAIDLDVLNIIMVILGQFPHIPDHLKGPAAARHGHEETDDPQDINIPFHDATRPALSRPNDFPAKNVICFFLFRQRIFATGG
jgi:hypothetical protein